MTLMIVILVAILQLLATVGLYAPRVFQTLGLSGIMAEIVFVLPSVTALVVNSGVILASPLFRTHRIGFRLALVICCAAVPTVVAFAAAMIVGLNKWGS